MARTPSNTANEKVIFGAVLPELFAQRGIEGASMDAIAEASTVSKATIYNHWADKDALLLEVLEEIHGLKTRPTFDSGDIRKDITDVLAYRPPEHAELRARITPHFVGYSAKRSEFGDLWRKRVMDPPRRELAQLLNAGIDAEANSRPWIWSLFLLEFAGPHSVLVYLLAALAGKSASLGRSCCRYFLARTCL